MRVKHSSEDICILFNCKKCEIRVFSHNQHLLITHFPQNLQLIDLDIPNILHRAILINIIRPSFYLRKSRLYTEIKTRNLIELFAIRHRPYMSDFNSNSLETAN